MQQETVKSADFLKRREVIIDLLKKEKSSYIRDTWGSLITQGYSIADVFLDEGKPAVALFEPERDAGLAEIFIQEMFIDEISIDCIITDCPTGRIFGGKYGIECVKLDELSDRSIDFIVIVSSENYYRTRISLLNKTSANVISLKGLIDIGIAVKFFQQTALLFRGQLCCFLEWPKVFDFEDEALFDSAETIVFSPKEYQKNPRRFQSLYSDIEEYSDDYIREIFQERPIVNWNNTQIHADCSGRFVNIINGRRLTPGQPDNVKYGVYICGGCMAWGIGTDDRYTISSFLQKSINDYYYGSGKKPQCAIHNLGQWGASNSSAIDFIKRDEKKNKLIIFVYRADLEYPKGSNGRIYRYIKKSVNKYGFHYINLTPTLYEVEKNVGTYLDGTHTNHRGYKAVANKVWNDLLKPVLESEELSFVSESIDTLSFWDKWQMLLVADHPVSEYFTENNIRNVAVIYNDSEKRHMLYDLADSLTKSGVIVTAITEDDTQDKRLALPNAKHRKLSEVKAGERPDITVLVAVKNVAKTKELIKGLLNTDVIDLSDVVSLIWDKYFFYPKISEKLSNSRAYFCIGFLSDTNKVIISKGTPVNMDNEVRRTVSQPSGAKRRVHVFGGNIAFGIGADDEYTIPSSMQEQMNIYSKMYNTAPILIQNYGICGNGVSDIEILEEIIAKKMRDGSIADDDIIIWLIDKRYSITESDELSFVYLSNYLEQHGIQMIDLTQITNMVQTKTNMDKKNVNRNTYKEVAIELMDYVKGVIDGDIPIPNSRRKISTVGAYDLAETDDGLTGEQNMEFREYLEYLVNERPSTHGNIGAIVMNCNPFTKGHRYLVERAAVEVDYIYVFVVEEDRSYFPFIDRFKLVSEGLRDIENVRVLRSGKFIISTITFPDYFTKDSAKEVAIDASLDLRLFCKYIVPTLGINVRFVGSEPTDIVTRQYNKAIQETLPQYGVKFVEFERITNNDTAISASVVRKLLDKKDWSRIRDFVPDVTYKYLREKFTGAEEFR